MKLQTLEEFIERTDNNGFPRNAYVTAPGFKELYVRRSKRWLNKTWVDGVLDIARVEVKRKGSGVFTALVMELLQRGIPIYVECVVNKRFESKLERLGFTRFGDSKPFSFFKLPKEHDQDKTILGRT